MSGSAGDSANADEVSDPLQPDVRHPDTFASRSPETASKSRERMTNHSQPGESQATSRRNSDTPTTVRDRFGEVSPQPSGEDEDQGKSVLEKTHEVVAKALGGSSRGSS